MRVWSKDFFYRFSNTVLFLSLIVGILELVYGSGYSDRMNLGLRRFTFVVGEPNFSSLLYLSNLSLAAIYRIKWKIPIYSLLILLAQSRMGLVGLAIAFFLILIRNYSKLLVLIARASSIVFLTYPVFLFLLDKILTESQKIFIVSRISSRYYVHNGYFLMGLSNFFGVGYFNGKNKIMDVFSNSSFSKILGGEEFEIIEQHNFLLQMYSEFGAVGWIVVIYLFLRVDSEINYRSEVALVWVPLVFSLTWVNALHEVAFYLVLAFVFSSNSKNYLCFFKPKCLKKF